MANTKALPTIESICGAFLGASNSLKPFIPDSTINFFADDPVEKARSYLYSGLKKRRFAVDFTTAVEQQQLATLIFEKLGCGFKDIKPVLAKAEMPELSEFLRRYRPQQG